MSVFVDASAFYALLNKKDDLHKEALSISKTLAKTNEALITSNYTLAEAYTVIRSKLGFQTAQTFIEEIRKNGIQVAWIDEEIHNRGLEIFLENKEPRDLSFFDCVDLALMESLDIEKAFCFDRHFKSLGITLIEGDKRT
ncbi:MAG: PIN domain-containing protein [Actinobacteria bacterium]|nr:PIN domain-containing protein [Actinomycetota bacterium]